MSDIQDPFLWADDAFADGTLAGRYRLYRNYADGRQNLAFATPKYAATFGRLFEAFSYNRCSGVVDAHADRLQVEGFQSDGNEAVAELAREIWDANRMDVRAGQVHREAVRAGDAYVIVWPETLELADGGVQPTIWPQRAEQIRVHYDDERPGLITLAAKMWLLHDDRARLNLYWPDRIERYVSSAPVAGNKRRTSTWSPDVSAGMRRRATWLPYELPGEPWPVPNPWGTVPVFHFANDAEVGMYGRSELRDVVALQDGLNKVLTDFILASEQGGFPQKVILGLDADDEQVREGLRRLEGGLNKIFSIPADADGNMPSIAEFAATNLQQFSAGVELFDTLISRATRVPVHYLQMSGTFPSGRALRIAEAPFVGKIEDRQAAYGNVWEDAMALALRMRGVADPGRIEAVWKSAAPLSIEDAWDVALQKSAVGLPLDQILREMGTYDEEEIARLMAEKERAAMAFDVALTGQGTPDRDNDDDGPDDADGDGA